MISREDHKDVKKAFGAKAASAVSHATNDARNKAIHAKKGGSKINDSHFGVNPKNNQWEYLGKPKTKKLEVKHSDEKHFFYRTMKSKSDYGRNHLKSMAIHPSRVEKSSTMYTSPTGSKHRIGSQKHKHWEGVEKRGEADRKYGAGD